MKNTVFRPAEFWKSSIMTMPDTAFFELARSVFGKIKTPFNKQQLVNDLEAFLLREDIQNAVSGYIDQNDSKVIAAVGALGEPAPGELESFFSGELSYAQLHDIVVNLEERFILYRFMEEKSNRLALNPVLKPALHSFVEDNSSLFPSVSAAEEMIKGETSSGTNTAALNDRILAGLLSFVSEGVLFFRTEGSVRKRIIEEGKTIFPGIDMEPVLGGLQALGLLYIEGEKLVPDYGRFNDFAILSPRQRMEYCAAGILGFSGAEYPADVLPVLLRGRIRNIMDLIHCFVDSLDPERLYPVKTLKRLADILKRDLNCGTINNDKLIEFLEKTGLVMPAENSTELKRPGFVTQNQTKPEGPVIAADSDFSFLVYPEIDYADAISLAAALSIREAGTTIRFELTRDSAVRAFDRNISAGWITELLKRLSDGRISETLIWSLNEWEKRYGEVSLKQGLVLSLSEERRYLVQTKPLAGLIRETLAPGLYLLPENTRGEAAEALAAAGVDIVACRNKNPVKTAGGEQHNPFSSPGVSFNSACAQNSRTVLRTISKPFCPAGGASTLTENFRAILEEMPLGKTERDELAARIDRKLILCEAQLKNAVVRFEKLEARMLDYAGKMNIAKQALAQQSPVELVLPGREKDGQRIFGIPRALEKEGSELVLVIVPSGTDEALRVPLGKISLLRRIKKSIFEIS